MLLKAFMCHKTFDTVHLTAVVAGHIVLDHRNTRTDLAVLLKAVSKEPYHVLPQPLATHFLRDDFAE